MRQRVPFAVSERTGGPLPGQLSVVGEVLSGPLREGDTFTVVAGAARHETSVRLTVERICRGHRRTSNAARGTNVRLALGLVNAKTYTFRIAAINARGTGPRSVATAPVTVGAPNAPGTPTATAGSGQATVHWTAPSNNGAPITGYIVTPYMFGAALTPVTFASTATTETITGLTPGTFYVFRIAAKNARGTGLQSTSTPSVKIT